MTTKELQPANDSGTPNSQKAAAEAPEVLSLDELANRQQAAMVTLKETNAQLDTLIEKTAGSFDEIVAHSKEMNDEVQNRASEQAGAGLEEAKAQAQKIISDADMEKRSLARDAVSKASRAIEGVRKLGELVEAGRISAAKQSQLYRENRSAFEAPIDDLLQTVLKVLQKLEQEAKLLEGPEGPRVESTEAKPDSATFGHSEKDTESLIFT